MHTLCARNPLDPLLVYHTCVVTTSFSPLNAVHFSPSLVTSIDTELSSTWNTCGRPYNTSLSSGLAMMSKSLSTASNTSLSLQAPTAPDASPVQTIQTPEAEQSPNNTGNTNTVPNTTTPAPANVAVLSALETKRIGFFESHLSTLPHAIYQNYKDDTVVTLDKAFEAFRQAIGPTPTPESAAQMILQTPFNATYSPGTFWVVLQHIAKSAPQITEDSLWETFTGRIQHLYDKVLREVMGETRQEQLDALNEEYRDDLDVWLQNLPSIADDPYPQVTAGYNRLYPAFRRYMYSSTHAPTHPVPVREYVTPPYFFPLPVSTTNATHGSLAPTLNAAVTPLPGQPWTFSTDPMLQLTNQVSQMAMYANQLYYQYPYRRRNPPQNYAYHQAMYQQNTHQARFY